MEIASLVDPLSVDTVMRALDSGRLPSVRFSDAHGLTLLHHACAAPSASGDRSGASSEGGAGRSADVADDSSERARLVRWLCERGASVHAADAQGWTPLHASAQRGDVVLLEVLLEAGADPSARSRDSELPVHFAVQHSYPLLAPAGTNVLWVVVRLRCGAW
jgi:Ankyrin repeats (3 copies)